MTETQSTAAPDSATNPGDPGTLLFENDRVRVWELVMQPGEVCNWHQHNDDHLLIVVSGSAVEAENADGTTSAFPISDNHILFVGKGGQTEVARNVSTDKVLRELIIDLKDSGSLTEASTAMFGFFQPGTPTTTRLP
jgi:mannose-6-phosphate isomerase-like protein (cupin superfamily)